jgi:imidazolonepropionase-like amidohydrolase
MEFGNVIVTFRAARWKFFLIAVAMSCSSAAAADLRIDHVTIVSPERATPMRDATVVIQGDKITSIYSSKAAAARSADRNVEVIDGTGLYLSPGLIDSHVHTGGVPGMGPVQERANPEIARAATNQVSRSYLYFGFTTLIDLISTPRAIAKWNAHDVHPDIYFCGGTPIVDGYPMNWDPKPERYQEYPYLVVQKGEESRAPAGVDPATHTPEAVVARMKADGAICVKTFFDRGAASGDLPVPRFDTLQALVRAAHAAKMPVLIHATSSEGQTLALDAGVDIIAHGLWNWNGEPQTVSDLTPGVRRILDRVIQTKTMVQPTMQVAYGFRDLFDPGYLSGAQVQLVYPVSAIEWFRSPQGQWFHDLIAPGVLPKTLLNSSDFVAKWAAARSKYAVTVARDRNATEYLTKHNARLLFGTDTPAVPTYANPPGLSGWLEMHRLIEAGLTPAQIFRAATEANAQALRLEKEIGTVQVGKRANLLLLRENPAETIEAYDEIAKVILRGRVLDRKELAADRGAHLFSGTAWIVTSFPGRRKSIALRSPAARKPGAYVHVRWFDACVSPLDAAAKTSCF